MDWYDRLREEGYGKVYSRINGVGYEFFERFDHHHTDHNVLVAATYTIRDMLNHVPPPQDFEATIPSIAGRRMTAPPAQGNLEKKVQRAVNE